MLDGLEKIRIQQNILASMMASVAWLQYHTARAICATDPEEKQSALRTARTHAANISSMAEEYKSQV